MEWTREVTLGWQLWFAGGACSAPSNAQAAGLSGSGSPPRNQLRCNRSRAKRHLTGHVNDVMSLRQAGGGADRRLSWV